jgi:hypothetical protein
MRMPSLPPLSGINETVPSWEDLIGTHNLLGMNISANVHLNQDAFIPLGCILAK